MRVLLILASTLAFVLGAANAEHCYTYSTSQPEMTSNDGQYYLDNDLCQPECFFSMWFYQESNSLVGLQRNDEVVDDTCHGMVDGDTIIW